MISTALKSRMGRRIGVVMCLCAIVPVLAFASLIAHRSLLEETRETSEHLHAVSRLRASELASKLGAAEAVARMATTRGLHSGIELAELVGGSQAFRSVSLAGRDGQLAGGGFVPPLSSDQLSALDAGRTVLISSATPNQVTTTFLVRATAEPEKLAYFELESDWLWNDFQVNGFGFHLGVVDSQAQVLFGALTPEVSQMVAQHIDPAAELDSANQHSETQPLSWQAARTEWRGLLHHVPLATERVEAPSWAVVVFMRVPAVWSAWGVPVYFMPVVLLLACITAMAGTTYLLKAYLPPMVRLRQAISALKSRRFEMLPASGRDEAAALVEAFNRGGTSIQEQFRVLETLGQIDQLLLSSADLESVLDAILSRVQAVTRCHTVGIVLRDTDAPGRGRVYLTAMDTNDLPVCRVALDDGMLATLATEVEGLTITRCEPIRHSFLKPLKDLGSEFFWVWPVLVGERLEAILAVGYREAPITDPQVARSGSEFADRLAAAVLKNARDEHLYRQAHYDPLTSLPNRLLFRERLSQELANAAAGMTRGALLYIDLDHFKKVNDTVGHSAGDQLLTIVAQRLRACVKDGDMVSRLGGDEFTVILRNVPDPEAARIVATRIVESLQLPVNLGSSDHYVCASIGITMFPDDGTTIEELVRNADTAMYRAKEQGRGRVMFFDQSLTERQSTAGNSGLHRALKRREFSLFYQPQFFVADGSLAGIEALLRWQAPRGDLRQPDEFVPAAEESGLIVDIGGWVLDAACSQLAVWRDKGLTPPRLAINISSHQLKHADFPKTVRRALDKYGLPAELLELEVVESAFADPAAGTTLVRLAQLGVRLTLDDFGTGNSSMSFLRQYPISAVKIDRSFVEDVPNNPSSATVVDTIIAMAHALGKRVIAEGIESIEQLDFLRERRCDCVQGYYLARPVAAAEMTELLIAQTAPDRDAGDIRATG